jgi:hypothetical protein
MDGESEKSWGKRPDECGGVPSLFKQNGIGTSKTQTAPHETIGAAYLRDGKFKLREATRSDDHERN